MTHRTQKKVITLPAGVTTSPAFDISCVASVAVQFPAALTATTFTWEVTYDDQVWDSLRDSTGTAIAAAACAANRCVPAPEEIFCFRKARIVLNASDLTPIALSLTLKT